MNDLVIMERQNIVDIADAIRNKTGVNDEMTLVDMVTSINEIEMGGEELPSAEDAVFGISSGVQENAILNATNKGFTSSKYLYGWSFEAKDPITIIGLRCYESFSTSYPHELKVWNEQKECLVTVTCYSQANNAWTNIVYLDTPINVDTGKTYTVTICRSILNNGIGSAYADLSTVTFNPKITYIHSVSGRTVGDKNTFPADTYTSSIPMVDMIITEQEVIPPDNYQIQRVTVDNIAVEMQRITGQSMKLSTAQIQSGLESIVLQEKIVTPTTEQQEIVPDTGYYGLSKITIEAAPVCKELTNAEDYTFGVADDPTEYAITNVPALTKGSNNSYYAGMKFTVLSEFSFKGFRIVNYSSGNIKSFTPKLYRISDNQLIASASGTCAYGETSDILLDSPINLTVGETYAVFIYINPYAYVHLNNITINSKIGSVVGIASTSNVLNDIFTSNTSSTIPGVVFPIMGNPIGTDIPSEYKIQLKTINDIAEETQRITGVTGKMSTAQIITALQELNIELQSKTIIPTDAIQEVVPDSDYYGLSKVTVEATAASEGLPSAEEGAF